jgi:ATP-binding cassette subfamily B protein/subfamily B ATP-binding cassette protein MsbA
MTDLIFAFRRIWPFLRPFKPKIGLFFLTSLIVAACGVAAARLLTLLMRDVLEFKDVVVASWLPFAFPALYLTWGVARYINSTTMIMTAERVVASIRQALLDRFLKLNLSFHMSFRGGTGGLISRVMNDTIVLQQGLAFFGDLIREPLVALGLLGSLLYLDWRLTLILLLCTPVFVLIQRALVRSLRKYGHESRVAVEDITSTLKESLDGVRVIQSFGLERKMAQRFGEQIDRYLRSKQTIVSREEAVSPLNEFLVSLMVMGLTLYAIRQIFGGHSTGGEFVAFIGTAGLLQPPLKRLQETAVRIQQVVVVVDRLWELLEHASTVPEDPNPLPFPKDWKQIRFDRVSFRYGEEWILKDVSLTIGRGRTVALVGVSGSGKSTLVNLLARFFDPTEGDILIDGVSIRRFSLSELRRQIALVSQDVVLFRGSVRENITDGANFDLAEPLDETRVRQAAEKAHALEFVQKAREGLATEVGERGSLFSGGEKQRISIARAIYKDAPILILDEATSALDSVSEMEVQAGLESLMAGRTAFVIAHRLSTIQQSSMIVVMKAGRVVEAGTHDQLIQSRGEYHSFYSLQSLDSRSETE